MLKRILIDHIFSSTASAFPPEPLKLPAAAAHGSATDTFPPELLKLPAAAAHGSATDAFTPEPLKLPTAAAHGSATDSFTLEPLKLPAAVNSSHGYATDSSSGYTYGIPQGVFRPQCLRTEGNQGFRAQGTDCSSYSKAKCFTPPIYKEEGVLATDSIIPETQLPGDMTGSTGYTYGISLLSPR